MLSFSVHARLPTVTASYWYLLIRGAESESELPGVVATSQESESESESIKATSTPTLDSYLQFDPVRVGQKYFSVKFSGILSFSILQSQHGATMQESDLKSFR